MLPLLPLLLPLLPLTTAPAPAPCPRALLQNATTQYLLAQTTGSYEPLKAILDDAAGYRENNVALALEVSVLSTPLEIDFQRSVWDTTECRTFTEVIAMRGGRGGLGVVVHTRMEFRLEKEEEGGDDGDDGERNGEGERLRGTGVESVVAERGDWLFNATGTYTLASPESWSPIPPSHRDTRTLIQSIGDAYFDRFSNASVTVPWGPPCVRIEGGLPARGNLTENGECIQVWPRSITTPYRRYVVDEVYGVVSLFVGFPGLDRTQGDAAMADSHVFRVEGGRIRYLHTASVCVVEGCGLNGTFGGGFRL